MSRTLRRLIPSPAMIVALVALVVALGGSGYAKIVPTITGKNVKNNSLTGKDVSDLTRKDIRKRSLRGRKFQLNSVGGNAIKESGLDEPVPMALKAGSAEGLDLWAVVGGDGTVYRGSRDMAGNLPSAIRVGGPNTGNYTVTFDRNVDSCSYQATIGSQGNAPPTEDSQITVSSGTSSDTVFVHTSTGQAVHTSSSTGANVTSIAKDRPFQLAVIC